MKKKHIIIAAVCVAVIAAAAAIIIAKLPIKEKYDKAQYPLKYTELVEKYCEEYELDEAFVYAVIRTESGFRPQAVSEAGAKGLMQLMPDTYDWLCMRLGEKKDDKALYDPETNIRLGTYLYHYLIEQFGDEGTAVAAYHAGLGIVAQWLEDPEYSKDGVHLHTIPYPDTAHYVDKVLKAEKIYKELYDL